MVQSDFMTFKHLTIKPQAGNLLTVSAINNGYDRRQPME